eukprot:Awhi_evm1s8768
MAAVSICDWRTLMNSVKIVAVEYKTRSLYIVISILHQAFLVESTDGYCSKCTCSKCGAVTLDSFLEEVDGKVCQSCYCINEECKGIHGGENATEGYCSTCCCIKCGTPTVEDFIEEDDGKVCKSCYCINEECKGIHGGATDGYCSSCC